jgi:hypothetical protein
MCSEAISGYSAGMANTRRTRAYRGGSRRTSGSGALMDTVKNTITGFTRNRGRGGRRSTGGGGLASQASGFIGGLLSGGGQNGRNRGRRRR